MSYEDHGVAMITAQSLIPDPGVWLSEPPGWLRHLRTARSTTFFRDAAT
jgi:hypothetical protein